MGPKPVKWSFKRNMVSPMGSLVEMLEQLSRKAKPNAQGVKDSGESECPFVMNRIEPVLMPKGS
jgi:hypothetical protein